MIDSSGWANLVGCWVQVHKDGRLVRTGYVDAVTESADALWIAAYGCEGRAMYEKAQGHAILHDSHLGTAFYERQNVRRETND
jgi:hypothetical protein